MAVADVGRVLERVAVEEGDVSPSLPRSSEPTRLWNAEDAGGIDGDGGERLLEGHT